MIGNLLNILAGLWLAYRAIFANPAGNMNNTALAVAAVAVVVFAVWARQTDHMRWQSGTNIVLAAMLFVVAVLRWVIGVAPLVCFGLSCSRALRSRLQQCGRSCIDRRLPSLPLCRDEAARCSASPCRTNDDLLQRVSTICGIATGEVAGCKIPKPRVARRLHLTERPPARTLHRSTAGGRSAKAKALVATRNSAADHEALSSIFLGFAVSDFGRTRCKTPSLSVASIRSRSIFSESVKTRS